MWTVDDEIRDEMSALIKNCTFDEAWFDKVSAVFVRADEMIYKESNILFPIYGHRRSLKELWPLVEEAIDVVIIHECNL